MLSVCLSLNGRFSTGVTPYGEAVDSAKCVEFFKRTRELWRKRRVNPTSFQSLLLQMDNAPAHTARHTQTYLASTGVTLVKQAPYSPDLNLCDRFLFRSMKKHMKELQLNSCEDVEEAATHFLTRVDKNSLPHELDKLLLHCQHVFDNDGCYVDCNKYHC